MGGAAVVKGAVGVVRGVVAVAKGAVKTLAAVAAGRVGARGAGAVKHL